MSKDHKIRGEKADLLILDEAWPEGQEIQIDRNDLERWSNIDRIVEAIADPSKIVDLVGDVFVEKDPTHGG